MCLLSDCDGASYTGDAEEPLIWPNGDKIFYRGRRVREAVVAHLLEKEGMAAAEDVVVSGTSAGGLVRSCLALRTGT